MKKIEKAVCLALAFIALISTAYAITEHLKRETPGTMPDSIPTVLGESATGALNNDTQPQSEYQKGYQAGYQAGLRDAFQWMMTKIQEQMAGIPLEGPKIKQAVDSLTPQVGDLEAS